MDDSQLPRQRQHRSLASRVRQLWRCTPHQSNHTRSVDDASIRLLVPTHTQHRMLASKPDSLDVNAVSEIPDFLGSIDRICVVGVHDSSIVEHDIDAAPGVEMGYHCFH